MIRAFFENPFYRGLHWTNLRWMFTTFHMGHYQPLSWLSFGIDYLLWGMEPFGYHLTNILLHAANAVLFYFLSLRLLAIAAPISGVIVLQLAAGFSALFFAVHPLRVESVAWATERRDVLSGFFLLLTVLGYLKAVSPETDKRSWWRWMTVAVVLYFFSLLSKASGMTLPLVLLVLDVYPLRRLGQASTGWLGPEDPQHLAREDSVFRSRSGFWCSRPRRTIPLRGPEAVRTICHCDETGPGPLRSHLLLVEDSSAHQSVSAL